MRNLIELIFNIKFTLESFLSFDARLLLQILLGLLLRALLAHLPDFAEDTLTELLGTLSKMRILLSTVAGVNASKSKEVSKNP